MDYLPEGRRLGGAPMNVCYHLRKMGVKSTIMTQVGKDQNGNDILAELDRMNIDKAYCPASATWATSTVEVHLSPNGHIAYDIVANVAWDYIEMTPAMEALVAQSDAFVFGSLITRSALSCTHYTD